MKDFFEDAESVNAEKMEFQRKTTPETPFPIDALAGLKEVACAIQNKTQAPFAICASSILAAVSLTTQPHADVQLPVGGKPRPISNNFVTIAASGERKSAVDGLSLKSVTEKETNLRELYEALMPRHLNEKEIWEKSRKKIFEKCPPTTQQKELDILGPAPKPPLYPMITYPDPTYSGLHKALAIGQASVGIFSAEGGQFIGGHGMRQENKMETAAGFNSLWDGSAQKRVRSLDGMSMIDNKRVSMHLMAQPDTALKFMGDSQLEDQGLHARFLICFPTSTQGKRRPYKQNDDDDRVLDQYHKRQREILDTPQNMKPNAINELDPRSLRLSFSAELLWMDYDTQLEKNRGPEGYLSRISGLANKLPEHAARLAATLALYNDLQCTEIHENYMRAGILLAEYYANEAIRLKDLELEDRNLLLAERLLKWLREKDYKVVPLLDIYQLCPITQIRKAKQAKYLMLILEEHGYVEKVLDGKLMDGIFRRDVWLMK